jgi:hypothetical protein
MSLILYFLPYAKINMLDLLASNEAQVELSNSPLKIRLQEEGTHELIYTWLYLTFVIGSDIDSH